METKRCPQCRQATVVQGQIESGQESRSYGSFVPRNSRMFRNANDVVLPTMGYSACVSCGHLWSAIDPAKLREFIGTWGEELAKQELDEIDRGPYRDLPDNDVAREIAEQISELDALVRERKWGHVGRYREMRGVIWDQAIKETKNWHRLTREEKLALFGWEPKKQKQAVDDLDDPLL